MLVSWKAALQDAHQELLACAMAELAKPVADLREEFSRMLVHLDSAIALAGSLFEHISPGVTVRHLPVGCIAIVTPWNNPFAIAVGKIAPALACGNSVVWKPAPETARTSACLVRTLVAAGMPAGLVSLVHGDGATAEKLIRENGIAAVAVTGSVGTGERVRAACLRLDKPLQAELGGNNSYIIWDGADLPQAALLLSKAGFRFAGQRCTAIRRLIVKRELFDDFTRAFLSAAGKLKIGLPQDADTEFSPMISLRRRARIKDAVTQAVNAGATLLHGGGPMDAWPGGCGFAPTVLIAEPDSNVFVEESFGPVVVLTAADDIRKAVEIGNAVPHGLIAGMWGGGNDERAYFLRHAQAGMLRLDGDMTLDPAAPFCGWKKSSIGPPEHGRWDLEFYARPQVIYGLDRDGSSSHAGGSA
jgi:acyl-CoA reductase-like NAD-dependent aldehyde dehydrogenase